MLFTKSMNLEEMNKKFQEGVKLWDDGYEQEGAELWANQALLGDLNSISRLARMFIDQREFEKSETYLKFATDQSSPLVQNLRLEIAKEREAENLRIEQAANPDTSLEILETLAKDGSIYVRHNVAANPSASLAILELLSKDHRALVRGAVAVNPNSNLEILSHLSKDVSFFIQDEVAKVMMALVESPDHESSVDSLNWANGEKLKALSTDADVAVRREILEDPNLSQWITEAPFDVLETLLKDENEYLKSCAKSTLREKLFENQLSGSAKFLDKRMLKIKKELQYFSDAERFFKAEKNEDAVELLFELVIGGHIESFERLFDIYLNQEDFEYVEELLNEFPNKDNPRILYLWAKLIEKSKSTDLDLYIEAANAGSLSAMLTLVEKLCLTDRDEAKKWLDKAKTIGFAGTQHYEEMLQIKPLPISLKIIVVRGDVTGQWLEYVVQRYESSEFVFEFESLETAINYCISQESGFAVIQVNEDWVRFVSESQYRIKIITHRDEVTIAEGIHDYWFGSLDDINAAIDELSSRDCDWEMVYYVSIDYEAGSGYGDDDDYLFDSSNSYQSPSPKIEESTKRSGFDLF